MKIKQRIDDLHEEMRSVMQGKRKSSPWVADPVGSVLTPDAMKLMQVLSAGDIRSVRELAQALDRAEPNVSRSLSRLVEAGLVRLVREGGRTRPELVAQEVSLRLNFATGSYRVEQRAEEAA